jgi:hypothetical protein
VILRYCFSALSTLGMDIPVFLSLLYITVSTVGTISWDVIIIVIGGLFLQVFFCAALLLFVSLRSFIGPPFTWKRNLLVSEIGPCNGSLSEMAWVGYMEMYDGFCFFCFDSCGFCELFSLLFLAVQA